MKSEIKTKKSKAGLMAWIDERFPLSSLITNHLTEYYAPKNFNFWYFFGALALLTDSSIGYRSFVNDAL